MTESVSAQIKGACKILSLAAFALVVALTFCAKLPAKQSAVQATTMPIKEAVVPKMYYGNKAVAVQEDATRAPGFTDEDAAVLINGTLCGVRIPAEQALSLLGEGYEYNEVLSCVYEGMDKTYDYGGLIVSTVPAGGIETVEMYTISSDQYCTAQGITVGATRQAIVAAYGDNWFDDGYMTYTENADASDVSAVRIQFYMEDDVAREIYVYSPSY